MHKGRIPMSVTAAGLALALIVGAGFHIFKGTLGDAADLQAAVSLLYPFTGWDIGPQKPTTTSATTTVMKVAEIKPRGPVYPLLRANITNGLANITAVSPKIFEYAHGAAIADGEFFIGMADRFGNTFLPNQIIVFREPADLHKYMIVTAPHAGDVETMTYDALNDRVYFALTGNHNLELYGLDPDNLAMSLVASSSAVDMGGKPAIVSDGTYIYGITNTDPSRVFKVKISDGTVVVSSSPHIKNGHSAAIASFGDHTELYFAGGAADVFEKVDGETLHSLGTVNLTPCSISNDTPFMPSSPTGGYVYLGCEIEPYGYRIGTADLAVTKFSLPGQSFGLFSYGGDLYNAARDGKLDVFPRGDLANLQRYTVVNKMSPDISPEQNLELNEIFYDPDTGALYFTAWWGVPGLFQISTSTAAKN